MEMGLDAIRFSLSSSDLRCYGMVEESMLGWGSAWNTTLYACGWKQEPVQRGGRCSETLVHYGSPGHARRPRCQHVSSAARAPIAAWSACVVASAPTSG